MDGGKRGFLHSPGLASLYCLSLAAPSVISLEETEKQYSSSGGFHTQLHLNYKIRLLHLPVMSNI